MIVGVPKETFPGEHRVALVPAHVSLLGKAGYVVLVETDAGAAAGYPDKDYQDKDARIVPTREELLQSTEIMLQVRALGANPAASTTELLLARPGQTLISLAEPIWAPKPCREAANKGLTVFAMELIPRITRAQGMDVLSSQANIAGYKAVLLASVTLPRMFPMFMTAAGTVSPAKVLVLGVGVAGLQAIATAKRLGAVVSAYDVRPAVKEQVESLGAKFVELDLKTQDAEDKGGYARAQNEDFYRRQRELLGQVVAAHDVVVTTAAIPGKKSPVLVTKEMVENMAPGSVIVDLAAERGGNCELTRLDQTVVEHGVIILGPGNLPATVPFHSSQMYSKNVVNLLLYLTKEGKFQLNLEDEIVKETLVCKGGEVLHPRVKEALGA